MNFGERIGPVDGESAGWILLRYRGVLTQPDPYEKIVSNIAECKRAAVHIGWDYVHIAGFSGQQGHIPRTCKAMYIPTG